jgi:hypothetical protein
MQMNPATDGEPWHAGLAAERRWWLVDLAGLRTPGGRLIAAPTREDALAAFRAEMTAGFLTSGWCCHAAAAAAEAGQPVVDAGPLTDAEAFTHDVGWTWAWEMREPRYAGQEFIAPDAPAARAAAAAVLGEPLTAGIEQRVAAQYTAVA